MSIVERLVALRDRLIFGGPATDALKQAEQHVAELEAQEAARRADVDAARASALAKIDAARVELRKTPRERPRMLWPTPEAGSVPVPFTPKGPKSDDR